MGDLLHKIKSLLETENLPYSKAKQEVPAGRGSADIVVYDKNNAPALVFELKQPDGSPVHDPYYPEVVEQACAYANELGVGYFVTTNLKHFVLWKTFQEGTPLLERQVLHYTATTPIETTLLQILGDLLLVKEGKLQFLSVDAKFVRRLTTFHEIVWPSLLEGLEEKLKADNKFRKEFANWLLEQDFAYGSETNEKIVKQYAHLLSNKIFFYKLLEGNFPELPKMKAAEPRSSEQFKQNLEGHFEKALEIDYEAVFSSTFFDSIPLNQQALAYFNQFIGELEKYKLSEIEYDVIGRVFESLIPEEERHYLGQYYTRADVVDLIEELCIRTGADSLLDPACGSGTFLVRGYYHLKNRARDKKHAELLSQIYGTDINQFAAHLSVINLTIRDLSQLTNKVNVLVNDFFNLKPTLSVLLPFSGKNIRNKSQQVSIPKFDAVVANPPYTRQEELGEYAAKYKSVLESAIREDWGGKYLLGKRAGIHAYFLLHAPKFLKPKGRLGFIVSNSWMDADYGKEIQKMLLENFRIKAIIESRAERWFEDAAVNTCILVAEQEKDGRARETNTVKFVLLKKNLQECRTNKLARMVEEQNEFYEDETLRIYCVPQGELWKEGLDASGKEWGGAKWGKYLRAPPAFFKTIKQKEKFKPLSEIADIKYGIKTGATDYFIIDKFRARKLRIEPRFLRPIVHSTKEMKKPILKEEDVENVLFTTHLDKASLRGTTARAYIETGEHIEISLRKSVQGRKHWWDVGKQEPAKIILTQFYNERHFAAYNKNNVQIENTFFGVTPYDEKITLALAAYMNSSLFALTKELYGRLNMGEGVLTIYGPDWKQMPVLDLEKLSGEELQKLEKAFKYLARREVLPVSEELKQKDRQRLDNLVFDLLGLSQKDRKEICETLAELVAERIEKAKSVRKNGNGKRKKADEQFTMREQTNLYPFL